MADTLTDDYLTLEGLAKLFAEIPTSPQLALMNRVPRRPAHNAYAAWDVELPMNPSIGSLNVADAEAKIVDRLRNSSIITSFATYREKKLFEPTALWLIRRNDSENDRARAIEKIKRELANLKDRAEHLAEMLLWGAVSGRIVYQDWGAQIDIDYRFQSSHVTAVERPWSNPWTTIEDMDRDIARFKSLVQNDSGVSAKEAFLDVSALDFLVARLVVQQSALADEDRTISDEEFDAYRKTGNFRYADLDWHAQISPFDPNAEASSVQKPTASKLIMGDFVTNEPIVLMEGPIADLSANRDSTGQFVKAWFDQDPSGLQILLDWNFIPAIERPAQIVVATV